MARITAVQDRLNVTLEEAKTYLRVDADDEDTLIESLIGEAKTSADAFLNNPFTDSSGANEDIPADIKSWVLRRVSFLYENRVENLVIDTVANVGSADYGGRRAQASSLDYALIRPYRLNPGL